MASPQLDGYGASRSGVALAGPSATPQGVSGALSLGTSNLLLWGLVFAFLYLAYIYRRVL